MPDNGKNEAGETFHYERAPEAAKSFLVQVLHKHHFKPSNLKKSWTKEEPLTWELFRALQLLPREMFLRQLFRAIARSDPRMKDVLAPLLRELDDVVIVPYPSLELTGNKRNRRADLGFGFHASPRIWLEVKTRDCDPADLRRQIDDEAQALSNLSPDQRTAVIPLVPYSLAGAFPTALIWNHVRDMLTAGVRELSRQALRRDMIREYEHLACELLGRIQSHVPVLVE